MFAFFTRPPSLLTYTKKNESSLQFCRYTCAKFYLDLSNRFGDKACGWADSTLMLSYYACCVTRESEFVYFHEADTYYEQHDILRMFGLHYWPFLWRGKDALLSWYFQQTMLARPIGSVPNTETHRTGLCRWLKCDCFRDVSLVRRPASWFLQVAARQTSPGTVSFSL